MRRRLRLHRQRNRWHRCVLRREHRRTQRMADMDLLNTLIQENRRELEGDEMTDTSLPPELLPTSNALVISDDDSLFFVPSFSSSSTSSSDVSSCSYSSISTGDDAIVTIPPCPICRMYTLTTINPHLRARSLPYGTPPFMLAHLAISLNTTQTTARFTQNMTLPHTPLRTVLLTQTIRFSRPRHQP